MKYRAKIFTGNGYHNKYLGSIQANTLPTLKRKASQLCNNYFNIWDRMEVIQTEVEADTEGNACVIEYHAVFHRYNKKYPNNTITRDSWR